MIKISYENFREDPKNCIMICKFRYVSGVKFFPKSNMNFTLLFQRKFRRNYECRPSATYYHLTDDEVRDMIIPRII